MSDAYVPPEPVELEQARDCAVMRAMVVGWNVAPTRPTWADGAMPDTNSYVESELFVAGALSTMRPFAGYHPAWALPFARTALAALSDWEPIDG
jgi:hypothetical protein